MCDADEDTTLDQTGVEALGFVTGPHTSATGGGIGTLLDAGENVIGQVVGISAGRENVQPIVSILFEMSGHLLVADVFSESNVVTALNDELSGFIANETVYFSGPDCTGATWVPPNDAQRSVFFADFHAAIITRDNDNAPNERRLFIVIPGTPITPDLDVEIQSLMRVTCTSSSDQGDMVSVTELDSDLHETFPKPYSVDFRPIQ